MKRTAISLLVSASLLGCSGSSSTLHTTGAGPDHAMGRGSSTGSGPPAPAPGPTPPVAAQRPHDVVSPNGTRADPYYWLRDDTRKDPDVLAYLNGENAYTTAILAASSGLEDTVFAEMKSRVEEDDASVPTFDNGYWYYTRFEAGKQQPIYARKKGTMQAAEEITIDGNALADGKPYFQVGAWDVSRDGKRLAWVDDTVGRREYVLHVKDLATGAMLPDTAADVAAGVKWANDNKTVFFVGKDASTLREDRILRHVVGTTAYDQIYKEDDGSYYVYLDATKSHRYLQIQLSATTNTEVRLIDADKPMAAPTVFLPRSKDHEYDVDHLDGRFWIRTNAGAKNFRLVSVADGKQANRKAWKDVIPASPDLLVESFTLARGFAAATVRTGGLEKVRVIPTNGKAFFLDGHDPSYTMRAVDLPDPDTKRVRYVYSSMIAPTSTFELDVATQTEELLKQQPVPGYDQTQYAAAYLHAPTSDGAAVPISVAYKKTTAIDGTAPMLVYGYGAYGLSTDPAMASWLVSLLDRGWVIAFASVRGGSEMGRPWYEAGKLMNKMNTFTDFIAATEYLIAQHYAAPDQVFARGGSAGGILMGVIANLRPDLYRGIDAQVPFVDVVTTMLDDTIPLTTNEYDEWGNPNQQAAYDYMLSYSPYDNVKAQAYPSIYVHTGLWDSQVQYYEPTKWVAKLRATRTDANLTLLDVDMTSGHGGASGRFDRLKQNAREVAFMLMVRDRPDRRAGWPK